MYKRYLFLITSLVLTSFAIDAQNHWETVVYNYDIWRYFVGKSEPPANWRALDFNDSTWQQGKGGFGYGDGDDSTVIDSCWSVYLRIKFNIVDTAKILAAVLNVDYDDAFIAYINGVEIARANITGANPAYNVAATTCHEAQMYQGGLPDQYVLNKANLNSFLINGVNELTVQVHNCSLTSSDMSSIVFFSVGIADTSHSYRSTPSWFTAPVINADSNVLTVNPDTVNIASNLPLVLINTNGQTIIDGTKIEADMKIIDHGPLLLNHVTDAANGYDGKIGISLRGSFSLMFPQKGYGLETRDNTNVQQNVEILGMPSENDWVLEQHYNDKALMRNELAYQLFNNMGHYASRTHYCEVYVNNEYMGIYFFGEKIKQNKNRVNIAKLTTTENTGDSVTGGYILKNDNIGSSDLTFYSNFGESGEPNTQDIQFIYVDPKSDEITTPQKSYIATFINSFETALYGDNFKDSAKGYLPYINQRSFIDYFILGELTRNVDTYKKSRYMFKDRDSRGGFLNSGPAWDFDWAYKDMPGQPPAYDATDGSGWVYAIPPPHGPTYPGWAPRMMEDSTFINTLKTRYVQLRKTILDTINIFHYMDSIHNLVNQAQVRHYIKWPILGVVSTGAPEVEPQPTTYAAAVLEMKKWISTRLAWLDENMPGRVIAIDNTPVFSMKSSVILRIFPNPASDVAFFESDKIITKIEFFSLSGVLQKVINPGTYSVPVMLSGLQKGYYLIRITLKNNEIRTGNLVVE
jgi:hypothetical protein